MGLVGIGQECSGKYRAALRAFRFDRLAKMCYTNITTKDAIGRA